MDDDIKMSYDLYLSKKSVVYLIKWQQNLDKSVLFSATQHLLTLRNTHERDLPNLLKMSVPFLKSIGNS